MLTPELERSWASYLAAEAAGTRPAALLALNRFIGLLLARPTDEWRRWATHLAATVADGGAGTPVRFPLFGRVLLPALAEGVRRGEPGCASWLAHFEQMLAVVGVAADLPPHLRSAVGLLNEALRVDPGDLPARRRLVARLADHLAYTLHELPAGVLFGMDGATVAECEELLATLVDFRAHAKLTGQAAEYDRLVRDCDLHYRAYRDYRSDGCPGGSYERYLAVRRV